MKKRIALASIVVAAFSVALSAAPAIVGKVRSFTGSVSVTRSGKQVPNIEAQSIIYDRDLVKTGANGRMEIELDASTGMKGSLSVKASTSFYCDVTAIAKGASTTIDVMSGSVGVSVTKSSGAPTFSVRTQTASMGVRGTSFEVSTALSGALLVTCSEGEVACYDVDETGKPGMNVRASAKPGQVVSKAEDASFKSVPVAVSSLEKFRDEWITDENEVFRQNPLKVVRALEGIYIKKVGDFRTNVVSLRANAVAKKWQEEDLAGRGPSVDKATLMREAKSVAGLLDKIRKDLFLLERVYYRLQDIMGALTKAQEALEIDKDYTIGAFYEGFRKNQAGLESAFSFFRHIDRLYKERSAGIFGSSMEDEDFFGSDDF